MGHVGPSSCATIFKNGTVYLAAGFWNLTVVYQQGKGYAGLILRVYNSSSTTYQVSIHGMLLRSNCKITGYAYCLRQLF